MKRLLILCILALAIGGCYLFASFPDNDPLTEGLGTLYRGFKIVSAEKDDSHGLAVIKWAIVDPDTPDGCVSPVIANGIVFMPYATFLGQSLKETTEATFREAVFCINSPKEGKPCKILGVSPPEPQSSSWSETLRMAREETDRELGSKIKDLTNL